MLREEERNGEGLFWKGRALRLMGHFESAIEVYESAISASRTRGITLRSIQDISLIRIAERDMYLAHYTLERVESIPAEEESLSNVKRFVDGAVNMMKKKFGEGLSVLRRVDRGKLPEPGVAELVESYRAFGLFSEGKVGEAIEVYRGLERRGALIEGDAYNLMLCEGVQHGEEERYEAARVCFERARTARPTRVEPVFYLVVDASD